MVIITHNSGTVLLPMPGLQVYVKALNQNYIMQSGPKQKGHNSLLNSRTNVVKHAVIPAKRRGVKVEEPVNTLSLEDRIRALTIFEDEEVGLSLNDRRVNSCKILDNETIDAEKTTLPTHLGSTETTFRNIDFENGSDYVSGYYTALPVDIVAKDSHVLTNSPEKEFYYTESKHDTRNSCDHRQTYDDEVFSPQFEENGRQWKDYMQFLAKNSVVSTQNIDMAVQQGISGYAAGTAIHQLGSPAASRNQMHDFSKNNGRAVSAPVMNEFGHFQIDNRGQERGFHSSRHEPEDGSSSPGFHKESIDSNLRAHNSNGIYLLRPMQDFQEEHQSHIGGQTSGSIFQNQVITQQEYPFPGHTKQQEQQHCWPNLPRSHEQAYSNNPQQHVNPQHFLPNGVPNQESPFQTAMTPGNMAQASRGRASWQPWSSFEQQQFEESKQPNRTELNNSFGNQENIPNIRKQIRATSEQCLQESSKHIFASSADINKLFSGQKKPTASPQTPLSGHFQSSPQDHSFNSSIQSHVTEALWPESSQPTQESSKSKLQVLMHAVPTESSTTPIRTDPNIYIPSNAWTSVVSLPNSAPSEGSRNSFHSHNNFLSPYSDQHISSVQRSPLAGAELAMDRSQLPSLTSGYSSESELQQIEFNAEAIKKLSKFKKADNFRNTPVHDVVSLDRSTDSSVDTDNFGDYEPVYENPSMLIDPSAGGPMNQPINDTWSPNTTPLGQHLFPTPDSGYSEASSFRPNFKSQPQTGSSQGSQFTSSFNHIPDINPFSNNIRTYNNNNGHNDHTKAIISSQNKPVAMANHMTSMPNRILEFDNTSNLNKEISPANLLTHYPSQHNSYLNNHVGSNGDGYYASPVQYPNMDHCVPDNKERHLENNFLDYRHETNSYNYPQLSNVEIVRMLDVPFETTIICGKEGDRLSTLV